MLRFVLFLGLVTFSLAQTLSPYIKTCKRNDPKFKECVKNHADEAIPFIIKGDKNVGTPVLEPFTIPEITLDTGNQLIIKMKNVIIKGLGSLRLEDVDFDLEKKHIYIKIFMKSVNIDGAYDVDGKVLIMPIQGSGPFHLELEDLIIDYNLHYKLMMKNGKEHFDPDISPKLSYKVGNINLKVENLFNGNKELEDKTNAFINEHIKELNEDFSETFVGAIDAVSSKIIKHILPLAPYDEIFPV